MQAYTLKEASEQFKIPQEYLKRAIAAKKLVAAKVHNNQYVTTDIALEKLLNEGLDFASLPKLPKQKQPEHLRKHQEEERRKKKAQPAA